MATSRLFQFREGPLPAAVLSLAPRQTVGSALKRGLLPFLAACLSIGGVQAGEFQGENALPVKQSLKEAVSWVLGPDTHAFAAWANTGDRGSMAVVARYNDGATPCRDLAYSQQFLTQARFREDVLSYCAKETGDGWRLKASKYSELDEEERDAKMNATRLRVPPSELGSNSVWFPESGKKFAQSVNAAFMIAVMSSKPTTVPWKSAMGRGVISVMATTHPKTGGACRILLTIRDDDSGHTEDRVGVCRETLGIWNGFPVDTPVQSFARYFEQMRPRVPPADPIVTAETARPAAPGKTATPASAQVASPPRAPVNPADDLPAGLREKGPDALEGFPGFTVSSEQCEKAGVKTGAPWGDKPGQGATGFSPEDYRANVAQAQRLLQTIYGRLGAERQKSLDALWAPFFDHPTASAWRYFSQLNPLLEDYVGQLSELDGRFAGFQDAVLDLYVGAAVGSKSYMAAAEPSATLHRRQMDAAQERLMELNRQIAALGQAPNPLAAKCHARARHKKLFEGGGEIWKLLHAAAFAGGGDAGGDFVGDIFVTEANTPRPSLTWNGSAFSYKSQTDAFDNPCASKARQVVIGNPELRTEARGTLSADGMRVLGFSGTQVSRSCENRGQSSQRVKEETTRFNTARNDLVLYQGKATEAGSRLRLVYTNAPSLDLSYKNPPPAGTVLVEFRNTLQNIQSKTVGDIASELLETTSRLGSGGSKAPTRTERPSGPDAVTLGRGASADGTKLAGSQSGEPSEDTQATQEAISQHETLAQQILKEAERWAEDARREKDPARKAELEKRADAARANAQNELDIAASLKTGTLVHTRTDWDKRMNEELIQSIEINNLKSAVESDRITAIYQLRKQLFPEPPGLDERISLAIRSPDRFQQLETLEKELGVRAVKTGKQAKLEAERTQAFVRLAEVENLPYTKGKQIGATVAIGVVGALSPYLGAGVAAWGIGRAYWEGGAAGAAEATVRMFSAPLDVLKAGYDGYFAVDPTTGKPAGLSGAVLGAGESYLLNKAMAGVSTKVQNAVAKVNPPAARAMGELRDMPAFEQFKDTKTRYQEAMKAARTPEELAATRKMFETNVRREEMQARIESASRESMNFAQYKEKLNEIRKEYSAKEDRGALYQAALERAGLKDAQASAQGEAHMAVSGGTPQHALSDMDFTPLGRTPSEAYGNGKKFVVAMEQLGKHVLDFPDRWVITETDSVVWKPRIEGGMPGSTVFELATIRDTLRGSDKMPTRAAVEHAVTKHTDDPAGAVVGHMKKAAEGFGSHPPDLHLVAKSVNKAAEIAGVAIPASLKSQLEDLHTGHKTPEEVGIVGFKASPEQRARDTNIFLARAQEILEQSFIKSSRTSASNREVLQGQLQQARSRGDYKSALELQNRLGAYTLGNRIAIAAIADFAPQLVAQARQIQRLQWRSEMQPRTGAKPAGFSLTSIRGYTPIAQQLSEMRKAAALPTPMPERAFAFGNLGERCKEGARRVDDKLKSVKAGSQDAEYLKTLKATLEKGAGNPAEAIRQVRAQSGFELATVLKQLGVDGKPGR